MSNVIDAETGEVTSTSSVLMAQESAAHQTAVDIAKRYPRSVQKFQSELEAWATLNSDTANECFYAKPQGGSKLVGPSIRFAELVSSAWGNIAVETRVVGEEDGHIVVEGTCRDLERNVTRRDQVRRPIQKRGGKRYPQHMVEQTINAGASIAARNAIFRVVPKALWNPIFERAKALALGEGETFEEKRDKSLDFLIDRLAVPPDRIWAYLGGKGPNDVTIDDLLALQAKGRLIHKHESTVDAEFPEARPEAAETAADSRQAANNTLNSLRTPEEEKPAEATTGPQDASEPCLQQDAESARCIICGPHEKHQNKAGGWELGEAHEEPGSVASRGCPAKDDDGGPCIVLGPHDWHENAEGHWVKDGAPPAGEGFDFGKDD